MKFLIITLFTFSSLTYANTTSKKSAELNMRFNYRDYDGTLNYGCDHKLVHELARIYDVYCFDDNNVLKKTFSTVVRVTKYTRTRKPENTYEIIYRVTQKLGPSQVAHTGSSNWINLEKDSPVTSMTLSQSIEKDTAGLYLDIKFE